MKMKEFLKHYSSGSIDIGENISFSIKELLKKNHNKFTENIKCHRIEKREFIPLIGFYEDKTNLIYVPTWILRILSYKLYARKIRMMQTELYRSIDIDTNDIKLIEK